MTGSTLAILRRLKTRLEKESKSLVIHGRHPQRACLLVRQAVAVGAAIEANKELMILKNEKVSWK